MSVFADMIDDLFDDPDHGRDAVHEPAAGPTAPCRVIRRSPDAEGLIGQGRFSLPTAQLDVRAAEVPAPAAGDVFLVDGARWRVDGAPRRGDADRLVWSCVVGQVPA